MFKYRLPSRTGIFKKSLEYELARIRKQLTESRDEGYRGLVARSMEAFRKFITTLGEPRYTFEPININNNSTSIKYYNEIRKTIKEDVKVAEADISNLSFASIESFNVAQILAKELEIAAAQVAGKSQDLALISKQDTANILIGGDDFNTKDLINKSFPLTMPQAFVDTRQGMVSLARTQSVSVIDFDRTEVEVKSITPGIDEKPESYRTNLGRFYEGRYYALAGQAEPEGGKWHLEELTSAAPDNGFYSSRETVYSYDGGATKHVVDSQTSGSKQSINPIESYLDDNGNIVIKNEIIIRDRGATEDEKNTVRKRMIDGNPDTYWQCEYVIRPSSFGTVSKSIYDNYTPAKTTDLRGTFVQSGTDKDSRLQVTPEDLRTTAKSYDNLDMDITITMRFPSPVNINWLNLNPMNFSETAWLKVVNIEVAENRNGVFQQIPDFTTGRSQNILTEDVNSELPTTTTEHIMSPNAFDYRGLGVWTFPTKLVQVVRFTLRQEVPTPVLYQKVQVQMHRIWEKVTQYAYKSESRDLRSGIIENKEWTRIITLEYLQSVQIMQGTLTAEELSPTTAANNPGNTSTYKKSDSEGIIDKIPGGNIADRLTLGISGKIANALGLGGSTRQSGSLQTGSDTGFYMKGYWIETFYDLIAYRIGIRDINAFMNNYDTQSEMISSPFYSPIDLKEISLRVKDMTPPNTSINYFITVDDGKSWHQINPQDKPSIYGVDGYAVPKVISFNIPGNPGNEHKYVITTAPVKKLMLRAVFTSQSSNNSPILSSYRLLMYPADSFRPQEFEI